MLILDGRSQSPEIFANERSSEGRSVLMGEGPWIEFFDAQMYEDLFLHSAGAPMLLFVLGCVFVGFWVPRGGLMRHMQSPGRGTLGCGIALIALGTILRLSGLLRPEADPAPVIAPALLSDPLTVLAQAVLVIGIVGATLGLWGVTRRRVGVMRAVRDVGRMSLTAYLAQSLLMAPLFAFLQGPIRSTAFAGIVVATWIILAAFCSWWMSRYLSGPVEWAWRCWTYRERRPLRRQDPVLASRAPSGGP